MKHKYTNNKDFQCKHCHYLVTADSQYSGVINRNHCPYCLHSLHVDLYEAGDRLNACKAKMQPVGLTLKKLNKKYGKDQQGELMLVHQCTECGSLSINRIAADDDADALLAVFARSSNPAPGLLAECERDGIHLLNQEDAQVVRARLFGWDDDHDSLTDG